MTHESNSLLKLYYRPIMCFPAILSTNGPKHVLLGLSQPRYLIGTLRPIKTKCQIYEKSTLSLGPDFQHSLLGNRAAIMSALDRFPRKLITGHAEVFDNLVTYFSAWKRDEHFQNSLLWCLALLSRSQITQAFPFTSSVFTTVDGRNICLVYPLSHSSAPACRCHWCERRVRVQSPMNLLWGKFIRKGRVGKQREKWKGA